MFMKCIARIVGTDKKTYEVYYSWWYGKYFVYINGVYENFFYPGAYNIEYYLLNCLFPATLPQYIIEGQYTGATKLTKVHKIERFYMSPKAYQERTGDDFFIYGSDHQHRQVDSKEWISRNITEYKYVANIDLNNFSKSYKFTYTPANCKYVGLGEIIIHE